MHAGNMGRAVAYTEWVEMSAGDIGQSIYDLYPLTDEKRELKIKSIETAYELRDRRLLADFASSREGLVNDGLRRKIWPLLLGMEKDCVSDFQGLDDMRHPEEEQVTLDVDRAFVFYPRFNDDEDDVAERKRDELKQKLQQLICLVLRKTPQLSYYQGYHDIAQVILLVYDMDVTKAAPVLDYISRHFLRDYMLPHIEGTIDILKLIPPILTLGDPYLGEMVRGIEPFYALSPILTFLSHHIQSYRLICNVFDYLFARNDPSTILYFYAALIICKRKELKEVAGDRDVLHSVLSNLVEGKETGVDLVDVITNCDQLMTNYPLQSLGNPWKTIMDFSALRTTRTINFPEVIQSQIEEQETRLKTQPKNPQEQSQPRIRPSIIGLSIVIGVLSIYLTQRYLDPRFPS